MESYFITEDFKMEINNNVVRTVFPNLNNHHRDILFKYLINVIDIVAIKFNFDIQMKDLYEQQFRQNNYRDVIGLLLMLLPYIDDSTGDKKEKINIV